MSGWWPTGRNNQGGWRLDTVTLLAVIGESAIADHSQTMTASWLSMLPRIIPAPQALLKPSRPSRMPQVSATVVGVYNGTLVQTLNYFPNLIHPIDDLPAFAFRVYEIKHNHKKLDNWPVTRSTGTNLDPENQNLRLERHKGYQLRNINIKKHISHSWGPEQTAPLIPPSFKSPLNILCVFSFLLTLGIFIWALLIHDGVAALSIACLSFVSSITGYASYWQPKLSRRTATSKVPRGDVVIRTREGAFVLIKCDENVARELYTGTEECTYKVGTSYYRALVGLGTFLLMVSVVLLGNSNWTMQAVIGVAYIVLNGLYWSISLIPKKFFWDLDLYTITDVTPADAALADRLTANAESDDEPDPDDVPSFTRTMWYAIRETEEIGWLSRAGVMPATPEWNAWLEAAAANRHQRAWKAVAMKDAIIGTDKKNSNVQTQTGNQTVRVPGQQLAPAQPVGGPVSS